MKKIEVIIRPERLEELKEILDNRGVKGMTISDVMGCGNQNGSRIHLYKGTKVNISFIHKVEVKAIIEDDILEDILTDIEDKIATGNVGDGKVFVYEVSDAMRIRTGERGNKAI